MLINLSASDETLSHPFETVPAADEDEAADVLVEGEDGPHCDESPSERNAEEIASDHLHAPHHDDTDDDREIDVAGAAQSIHSEEIQGSAVLKQHLDP